MAPKHTHDASIVPDLRARLGEATRDAASVGRSGMAEPFADTDRVIRAGELVQRGGRHDAHRDRHVQERVHADHGRQADAEILAERVARLADPVFAEAAIGQAAELAAAMGPATR